jgi:putative ABC transport system permease protein
MLDDLRDGARNLWRQPGFTAVVVLTLALSIGATASIFSMVNAVLLRPLPYGEPERLVVVWDRVARLGLDRNVVSPANFVDWQRQNEVFERMGAYTEIFFNLGGDDGLPERVYGMGVTPDLFETLRVRPMLGRGFRQQDAQGGETARAPVLVSHGLWQRRFGGDRAAIGRTFTLNDRPAEIVGILPADFLFLGKRFDVFNAIAFTEAQLQSGRASRWLTVVARLKRGVSPAQAQAGMDSLTARLAEQYPDANQGRSANVRRLADEIYGPVRPALLLLQAAVGLVLLIAAANVAKLLLVRALSRTRELATRAALGATRPRLVRQLFAEGLLLSALGGVVGVLLATLGTRLVVAASPIETPRLAEARIDGTVVLFSLVVTLATSLACSVFPALQASRLDLHGILKQGGRSAVGAQRRLHRALVVVEVALSLVLLAGAGLLIKSFARLQRVDPGFGGAAVAMDLSLAAGHGDAAARARLFEEIVRRVEALPGVDSTGLTTHLPLSGESGVRSFEIMGAGPALPFEKMAAEIRSVSDGYFGAMGMTFVRGRGFTVGDTDKVVINQAMVRRFFAGEDPLGRRLVIDDGPKRAREIIGVVADVKHFRLDAAAAPEMYLSHLDRPFPNMTLVVRSAGADPTGLVASIRRELALVDKALPAANVKTLEEYLAASVARQRFSARLLVVFATAALSLAALGIYGVVAYSVAQRTPELGIRMALGADRRAIVRVVLADVLRPVALGVIVGLAAALLATRVMAGLLFEVAADDGAVFFGVTAVLVCVAFFASWLPARRAAAADPLVCLRS